MKVIKHVNLTPSGGNVEDLVDALTFKQGVKRKILALSFDRVASHDILANSDNKRLIDMPSQHLVSYESFLTYEKDLEEGETFKVGYRKTDAGAGAAHEITIVYDES